jgi:putative addiction module component (TIGR02574 family)
MAPPANDLLVNALDLPPEQRGELALVLLESLPDDFEPPIQLDPSYEKELRRRIEEMSTGRAKMHTLDEVMAAVRNRPSRRNTP